MKILWFPRLQFDIDKLHITTWREMCKELEESVVRIRIAAVGSDSTGVLGRDYIRIPVIKIKILRILTFWLFGWLRFLQNYYSFKPDVIILDLFTFLFSFPFVLFHNRKRTFIVDSRTPMHNALDQKSTKRDKIFRVYTKICYFYCKHYLDGITVITEHYKQRVHSEYDINPENIGVWESGVNLEMFSASKYVARGKTVDRKKRLILMQHGELSFNRGLFETVEAIRFLRNLDISLVLVGTSINRSRAKYNLEKLIKTAHLESMVHVLPPVSYQEVPKLISTCDCAVLAYPDIEYWNDNNPIKLLEYLAMGKVIICTDMWTFRDVLNGKRCAVYLKDNKPETIAAAIRYCYEHREYLREWGEEGVDIIRSRFTWRHQAQKLLEFIEKSKNCRNQDKTKNISSNKRLLA